MKLTRKQLRRLIAEAIEQRVPVWPHVTRPEIDALRQKGRQDADLSSLSQQNIAKLNALDQSGDDASVNQARNVYQALGSTEPDISVEQEADFFAGQNAMLQDMEAFNVIQMFYKEIEDYLTPSQAKTLARVVDKPLHAYIDHSRHGILFRHDDTREIFIDASDFDLMNRQIYLKNRNPSQNELDSIMNDSSDELIKIMHDLFKRIVKSSKQTSIYASDLEEMGIGELDEYGDFNTPFGELMIYDDYNNDIIDLIPKKLMLIM